MHPVRLHPVAIALDDVHRPRVGPALHLLRQQSAEQARVVGGVGLVAGAHPVALAQLAAKAAPAQGLFQAQRHQAQAVLGGQGAQICLRGAARGVQAIQIAGVGKVVLARVHQLRRLPRVAPVRAEPPSHQAAAAPQADVVERHVLLDPLCLQQQGTDFTGRAVGVHAPALGQHGGLVGAAQMAQHPRAQVHAFADVQGQGPFAAKHIHTATARQRGQVIGRDAMWQQRGGGSGLGGGIPGRINGRCDRQSRKRGDGSARHGSGQFVQIESHHAPDAQFLVGLKHQRRVNGVLGQQLDHPAAPVQALDSELLVHHRQHDVVVACVE